MDGAHAGLQASFLGTLGANSDFYGQYGVSILRREQEPVSLHFAGGKPGPDQVRFCHGDPLVFFTGTATTLPGF